MEDTLRAAWLPVAIVIAVILQWILRDYSVTDFPALLGMVFQNWWYAVTLPLEVF
jgi:hypothetical protein